MINSENTLYNVLKKYPFTFPSKHLNLKLNDDLWLKYASRRVLVHHKLNWYLHFSADNMKTLSPAHCTVVSPVTRLSMAHLSALLLLPLLAASVSACCDTLRLESGGMGDFYQENGERILPLWPREVFITPGVFSLFYDSLQGSRLGHYVLSGSSSSGKSIYTQTNGDNYMFYLVNKFRKPRVANGNVLETS